MSNIRVDLNCPIKDGTEVVFRSPVDCSQVTGLIVYYPGENGITTSKEFAFADAHGNNVGDIDHLFAENVAVKVILDDTTSMAFVQNADTNAYLEGRFAELENKIGSGGGGGGGGGGASVDDVIEALGKTTIPSLSAEFIFSVPSKGGDGVCVSFANYEHTDADSEVAVAEFYGTKNDDKVILRNIGQGVFENDAVNKGQLDAAVGDIESALDRIIEMQNSLIGGEA